VSSYWMTLRNREVSGKEALDDILWRRRFGRGYEPVVSHATEGVDGWMDWFGMNSKRQLVFQILCQTYLAFLFALSALLVQDYAYV
jgi:hypothetical protein